VRGVLPSWWRISDEDRAAFIMTLKMDLVSGCWEWGSSGNGDPHSGVLRIEWGLPAETSL